MLVAETSDPLPLARSAPRPPTAAWWRGGRSAARASSSTTTSLEGSRGGGGGGGGGGDGSGTTACKVCVAHVQAELATYTPRAAQHRTRRSVGRGSGRSARARSARTTAALLQDSAMATASRGGGTRTQTARPPREGCGCKPSSSGQCCTSRACGCRKDSKGCEAGCACGGVKGVAPVCDCDEPKKLLYIAGEGDNKGRPFWGCPKPQDQRCENAFRWADRSGSCANPHTADGGGAGSSSGVGGGAGLFAPINLDSDDDDGGGGSGGGGRGGGRGGGGGASSTSAGKAKVGGASGRGGGGGGGRGGGRGGSGRGGGRRKKACEHGAACPFQHEHQHTSEYSHPSDAEHAPAPAPAFSGQGQRLGGGGGGGSSSSSAHGGGRGGQRLGGGGGGGGGGSGTACEVCGAHVPAGLATEMHRVQHERDGSLARHRSRQEEAAIRQQTDAEYEAALAADQQRDRDEEAAREAAELEQAIELSRQQEAEEVVRAAAAKKAADEAAAAAEAEARRVRLKRARDELADEPAAGTPGTTMLRVRLPNGTVLTRRFLVSATVGEVFAWLRGCAELEGLDEQWSLTLPTLGARPLEGGLLPTDESLQELDLCGATIFVQDDAA